MWSSFKRLGILSSTISYLSFGCWELLEDDNPHGAISRVLEKARKMAAENQYGPAIGSGAPFQTKWGRLQEHKSRLDLDAHGKAKTIGFL